MKIEILYNFIPHGQIKKQNDVRIELNTRPTYLQCENKKDLYWNVPCGDTSSKTLIDVCVCVRRHIAKLRQE